MAGPSLFLSAKVIPITDNYQTPQFGNRVNEIYNIQIEMLGTATSQPEHRTLTPGVSYPEIEAN